MRSHGNVAYLKNVQLKRWEGRERLKSVIKIVFVPEYTLGTRSPPPSATGTSAVDRTGKGPGTAVTCKTLPHEDDLSDHAQIERRWRGQISVLWEIILKRDRLIKQD